MYYYLFTILKSSCKVKYQDKDAAFTLTCGFHPLDVASGPEIIPAEIYETEGERKSWNKDPGIQDSHQHNHTSAQQETLHNTHTHNQFLHFILLFLLTGCAIF